MPPKKPPTRLSVVDDAPAEVVSAITAELARVDAVIARDRADLLVALEAAAVPEPLAAALLRAHVLSCDHARTLALGLDSIDPYVAAALAWRSVLTSHR